MQILVACEVSGRVRDALAARGHDAWSCDLLPTSSPGQHIVGDVAAWLDGRWDAVIAFPPCTYLTRAAAWRWKETPDEIESALQLVMSIWNVRAGIVCIENPTGILDRLWRKPDQVVEPWYFGDAWTKRTCLWTRGLPLLHPTRIVPPAHRVISDMPGGVHRSANRSLTPLGMAEAMARQWF